MTQAKAQNRKMVLRKRNKGSTPPRAAEPAAAAAWRLSRLDWDLVRVFLAVARTGQLAEASQRLGLDSSTVSRRLDRLEVELGVGLLERTTAGTFLTSLGESLLVGAEEMERGFAELGAALDAQEAEAEGVVRLTAPPGLLEHFVAPALHQFVAAHPKVRLELDASVAYADLTRREADLALRVRRPERGDLISRRLVTVRSVPLGSVELVQKLGALRDTADAPWIFWGHDLDQIPEARWLKEHVKVPPILRTSSFASQLAAAETGLGLCLVPEPYGPARGLVPARPGKALRGAFEALPAADLWLVGHVALRRVPRVAVLWEFLVEALSQPWQGQSPQPRPQSPR